ncbi:DNA-binding protein [Bordetella pertussis]|nr:DNA-binding protein [Bordetella pertussis]
MRWRGISSQNQLARISGVPQSTIHRILARGDAYAPTRATLERLARALHTTVPWLSDGMLGTIAALGPELGHQAPLYPTLPPTDQWQGRTLHPVGLA